MRRKYQLIGAAALVIAVGSLVGCNPLRHVAANEPRSQLHLPQQASQTIEAARNAIANQQAPSTEIHYTNQDGTERVFIPAENVYTDTITNEQMWAFDISSVTISARSSRNLVERNGKIDFGFIVSVPDTLLGSDWQLVLNPMLRESGNTPIPLDPLVYRGTKFQRMQDREYVRYENDRDGLARDLRRYVRSTDRQVAKNITYKPDSRDNLDHLTDYLTPRYRYDSIEVLPGGVYYTRIDGKYPEDGGRAREEYIRSLSQSPRDVAYEVRMADDNNVRELAAQRLDWTNLKRSEVLAQLHDTDPQTIQEIKTAPRYYSAEQTSGASKKEMQLFDQKVRHPYYPNARLDTIVYRPDHRVDYYYSQEVEANENTGRLALYLQGGIETCKGQRYELHHSDTLYFSVRSMVSFLDERPRYRKRIVLRDAEANARFYFTFPKGRSKLAETEENRNQILAVRNLTRDLMTDPIFIIDSITLRATSSPEGTWNINDRLASERAAALQTVLVEEFTQLYDSLRVDAAVTLDGASQQVVTDNEEGLPDLPNLLRSTWLAEDWDELARLVELDEHLSDKEDLLMVINDRSRGADFREARLRQRHPDAYQYIRENIYPQMRAVDFRFNLHRRGQKQDTVFTDEIDAEYMAAIELMKKRRYEEALDVLRPYEDINTALAYLSTGYSEAAYRILKAQPDAFDRADIQYMLAIASARMGNENQAVLEFLRSCEIEPSMRFRGNLDPELSYLIKKYGLDKEDFDNDF